MRGVIETRLRELPTPRHMLAFLPFVAALLALIVLRRRRAPVALLGAATAAAIAISSCGHDVTAPGAADVVARGVSFRAAFPAAVSFASGQSSDVIAFNRVRVVFRHADGSVALDTVVAFGSTGADAVQLTFTLRLAASTPPSGERMTLALAYVGTAGDTVFRGGPTGVVVVPTAIGGQPPAAVEVPVQYTGPGANAAAVRISPRALAVPAGDGFTLSAVALDGSGATLANTPVVWRSLDTTAAKLASALAGAGTTNLVRTQVRIVAELLTGQADTATLTITPKVGGLALVSGGGQGGPGGGMLAQPVVVRVTATDGLPLAGIRVTFAASTGGSVDLASAVSDANGLAQVAWRLAPAIGAQSLTATAAGVAAPLIVPAISTSGPPVALAFTTQPADGTAGAALAPVVVTVRDAAGNRSEYTGPVTVAFATAPAGVSLDGTVTVNAVAGVATFPALRIRRAASGYTLTTRASSFAPATSTPFAIRPAPAYSLSLAGGNGQSGTTGAVLPDPISALVADSCGNPVSGVTLAFSVSTGGGTVSPAAATTGADGVAFTRWTLGAAAGIQVLQISGTGLTPSAINAGAIAAAPVVQQLHFVAQPTNTTAGITMSTVTVRGVNAIGALDTTFTGTVTLAFGTNPSGGALVGTVSAAAVRGLATFTTLSVRKAATGYTLTASASGWGGATSSAFDITAAPAVAVTVASGSGQTGPTSTVLTSSLVALVSDSCGNPVSGATVAWATASGSLSPTSGTTNASGTASSTWTLGATGGSVSATATVGVLAPATFTATASAPPATYSKTWTGATSTAWSVATNWSPSGVPATTDSVLVPVTTNQPVLTALTSVSKITIATGATLDLGGFELDAYGPISAQGTVVGTTAGSIIFGMGGAAFAGNFNLPSIFLLSPASLAGATTFSGNFTQSSGPLSVNGNTLTVTGNATLNLSMTNAADSVNIAGNLTVNTSANTTSLTAGTIVIGGNFIQSGNYQSFPARGTHKVVMKGTSVAQHISFFFPQNRYSHFNDLVIDNPAGVSMDSVSFDNGSAACGTPTCGGFHEVGRHLTILNGTLTGTRGSYLRIDGTLTDAGGGRVTVPRIYFDSSTTPISGTTPALSAPKTYFDGVYTGGAYTGPKRMSLAGNLTVNGELIFFKDDTLRLNGHALTVTKQIGTLCCTSASAIEMTNAADVLTVNGQFNVPRGVFTAGTIYADSAFIITNVQASGTHKLVMRGAGSFYFAAGSVATIDSSATGVWLNDVDFANTAADTLMIGGSVLVRGTLTKSTATPTVMSGQNSLPGVFAVNTINVTNPIVWNRVPLAIVGSGAITLNNSTFNNNININAENPGLGGTQQWHLSISRATAGTYTLGGLTFSLTSSLPTAGGNIWGFVNLQGPAGLTVNLTTATPSAAGGGTAKSRALGGATLNWSP